MNNLETAIRAIRALESNSEINEVIAAIKLQRTYLARSTVRSLSVGDTVEFQGRTGVVRGRVHKINRKTVIVDEGHTRWKVAGSLLTPV